MYVDESFVEIWIKRIEDMAFQNNIYPQINALF